VDTTYAKNDEIIQEGQVVDSWKKPNWLDLIEMETDDKVYIVAKFDGKEMKHYAVMESIKSGRWKTGTIIDITDKQEIKEVVQDSFGDIFD